MKNLNIIVIATIVILLDSCVSTKKFNALDIQYKSALDEQKKCMDGNKAYQLSYNEMKAKNNELQTQNDYLKKNNGQMISALQDLSVMSSKQAESVKQSLASMSQKEGYIKNLQSAIARKDSLNMVLVMNLKSSLSDVNDKDINIKVEKGVVFIDISDKLLFNSGKYAVTEDAKKVLGKVAKVLNAHPDFDFMVEGHTDNVPIHNTSMEDNWDLSVKRATSVVRILEQQYKIDPSRMTASGHSQYVPVAANDTKEGKALNRRTRIIILPQLDQFFKLMVTK